MFEVSPTLHVASPTEPDGPGVTVRLYPVGTKAYGWGWELETRQALLWLEAKVQPGATVADIGTGTGILAILAAKLGATVVAFEQDPDVREIAARNFTLNGLTLELRGEYAAEQGFDLAVANLGDVNYGSAGIFNAASEVWMTHDA